MTSLETKLKQREAEVERLRDRVNDDDAIKESLRERVTQLTEELSDAATGGEEAALKEKMQKRLADELAAAFSELQVCESSSIGNLLNFQKDKQTTTTTTTTTRTRTKKEKEKTRPERQKHEKQE